MGNKMTKTNYMKSNFGLQIDILITCFE